MTGFALNAERKLASSDDPQAIEDAMPVLKQLITELSQELNSGQLSIDDFDEKVGTFNTLMGMWNTNEAVLSMRRVAGEAQRVANSLKWPPAEEA